MRVTFGELKMVTVGEALTAVGKILSFAVGTQAWRTRKLKQARAVWPDLRIRIYQLSMVDGKRLILNIRNDGRGPAREFTGQLTGYSGNISWPQICRAEQNNNECEVVIYDGGDRVFCTEIQNPSLSVQCKDSLGLTHDWRILLVQQRRADGTVNVGPDHESEPIVSRPQPSFRWLWKNRRALDEVGVDS